MASAKQSSLAKQHVSSSVNTGKISTSETQKRPALADITNQKRVIGGGSGNFPPKILPCSTKIISIKKSSSSSVSFPGDSRPPSSSFPGECEVPVSNENVLQRSNLQPTQTSANADSDMSPHKSDDGQSISMDEPMSLCDSLSSVELDAEDLGSNEMAEVKFIEQMPSYSSDEDILENAIEQEMNGFDKSSDQIFDIDENVNDPQLCVTTAGDIFEHLRASELKPTKRPSANYMEKVQKHINASMRGILIDWLVEVAEEYKLVRQTLYLAVNYVDRYLSGNIIDKQRLQLLGITCMMIAAKYEEIYPPQLEEFCNVTEDTYNREDVLQMESFVLNGLKFEMTVPTVECFLRRFVRAARCVNKADLIQLKCLAYYIAELSLLDYYMLHFAPSLIAASSVFLAKYILIPSESPWNCTLQHYTRYETSDLHDCVMRLHSLCCNNHISNLPSVREKYNQPKHKYASRKHCPQSIPMEFFENYYP